ncbi:MAG TPA: hypothetical protein VGM06_12495 [Polyangiaceae bacterium]
MESPEGGIAVAPGDAGSADSGEVAATGKVVVESLGTEPRRAFRYAVQVGTKETLAMNMHMDMRMTGAGPAQGVAPPKLPAVQMRSTFEAVRLTPDGHVILHFQVDSTDAADGGDPSTRAELGRRMGQLVGMTGDYEVTDRGEVLRVSFTVPEGLDPTVAGMADQMQKSIRSLSTLFPEEAIGVGATWTYTRTLELPVMTVDSKLTYKLTQLDDRGGTVEVAMILTAPPQQMKTPVGGPRVMIDAMASKGHVTRRFDLHLPVPYSEDMETTSDDDMSFEVNGIVHPLRISMAMTMHVERAK